MKVKCPYCDYIKPDEPMSIPILKVLHTPDIALEDYMLWTERLVRDSFNKYGTKSYSGVKVHIGRMHKGEYNVPTHELNKGELAVVKGESNELL